MKNRLIASTLLAIVLPLGLTSAAQADEVCDPELSATGCMDNVTCEYERWHYDSCIHPWTISIKEECAQARLYNYSFWKKDAVCQSFVKKHVKKHSKKHVKKYVKKHVKKHRVKKGDTLWHISDVHYGAGRYWKTIAKANKVKGTTIRVGQVLVIPAR